MTRPDPQRRYHFGPLSVDLLAQFWNRPSDAAAEPGGASRRTPVGRLATYAVVVAIGLLVAVAYRDTLAAAPAADEARGQLADEVAERRAEIDDLDGRADQLRDSTGDIRDGLLGSSEQIEQLRDLEALAGSSAVTGDGAVVTVGDGPAPDNEYESFPGRVYDRDVQDIVNTLWALGAEAMAVDGQRLTTTTPIRAAGEVILVGFQPVDSPYEIAAIGPPDLADEFAATGTAAKFDGYAADYGMRVDVAGADGITVPAATVSTLQYAEPGADPDSESSPSSSAGSD